MRDTNIVALVGRLVRDVDLPQGNGPARFSIAVSDSKKQGETWVDDPSFFDVTYWHKSALPFLLKGKQVVVAGHLKQDRWEQDGQKRSKVVIVADDIQLLGGNAGQGEARGPAEASRPVSAASGTAKPGPASLDDDFTDDIPF